MSTAAVQHPLQPPTEPVFPLSVEQYHAMISAGVLTDDDPVELIEGVLVYKMPKNPIHPLAVRLLTSAIDAMLPAQWHFRAQEPVTLADGEPEPDGAIVRGQPRDFADRHPGPEDVELIIEVADTTLQRDRGIKLRSYARARIPNYWIINLNRRTAEVYSDPTPEARPPRYRKKQLFDARSPVPIVLGGKESGAIRVADLID